MAYGPKLGQSIVWEKNCVDLHIVYDCFHTLIAESSTVTEIVWPAKPKKIFFILPSTARLPNFG